MKLAVCTWLEEKQKNEWLALEDECKSSSGGNQLRTKHCERPTQIRECSRCPEVFGKLAGQSVS